MSIWFFLCLRKFYFNAYADLLAITHSLGSARVF